MSQCQCPSQEHVVRSPRRPGDAPGPPHIAHLISHFDDACARTQCTEPSCHRIWLRELLLSQAYSLEPVPANSLQYHEICWHVCRLTKPDHESQPIYPPEGLWSWTPPRPSSAIQQSYGATQPASYTINVPINVQVSMANGPQEHGIDSRQSQPTVVPEHVAPRGFLTPEQQWHDPQSRTPTPQAERSQRVEDGPSRRKRRVRDRSESARGESGGSKKSRRSVPAAKRPKDGDRPFAAPVSSEPNAFDLDENLTNINTGVTLAPGAMEEITPANEYHGQGMDANETSNLLDDMENEAFAAAMLDNSFDHFGYANITSADTSGGVYPDPPPTYGQWYRYEEQ